MTIVATSSGKGPGITSQTPEREGTGAALQCTMIGFSSLAGSMRRTRLIIGARNGFTSLAIPSLVPSKSPMGLAIAPSKSQLTSLLWLAVGWRREAWRRILSLNSVWLGTLRRRPWQESSTHDLTTPVVSTKRQADKKWGFIGINIFQIDSISVTHIYPHTFATCRLCNVIPTGTSFDWRGIQQHQQWRRLPLKHRGCFYRIWRKYQRNCEWYPSSNFFCEVIIQLVLVIEG